MSGCLRRAAIESSRPTIRPACGPPSSLSPLKATRSAPAATLSRTVGSRGASAGPQFRQRAAAEVINELQAAFARQRRQRGEVGFGGEAGHAEIAGMDFQNRAGRGRDRRRIVAQAGLVGGPDLDQARAALLDHLRNAKAAADFDQFAARNHHFAVRGQGRQRQQHGGGAIIDRQRGLRSGQRAKQGFDAGRAPPAQAGFKREFEIGIARRIRHGQDGLRGERRPAEIGVQHDPGGVDDANESRRGQSRGGARDERRAVRRDIRAVNELGAGRLDGPAQGADHRLARQSLEQRGCGGLFEQLLHLRQFPQGGLDRRRPAERIMHA